MTKKSPNVQRILDQLTSESAAAAYLAALALRLKGSTDKAA